MSNTIYIIYQTTNLVNNKYYIGYHGQPNEDFDGYLGSGVLLSKAINKYGKHNFIRKTLSIHNTSSEAFIAETIAIGTNFNDDQCYNLCKGGKGGDRMTIKSEHDRQAFSTKMRNIHSTRTNSEKLQVSQKLKDAISLRSPCEQQRIWEQQQETRSKLYPKDKQNNPMFKGSYQTPWGVFPTSNDATKALSYYMNIGVLIKWCKNNDVVITQSMISRNKYLTQDMLGITFKDLGFDFILKD
jgi:hypothetical protein